jgi:hypothetical protein
MRKFYLIIILLFCFINGNAQKQNYNWAFGNKGQLSWKLPDIKLLQGVFGTPNAVLTDLPINIPGSAMETFEGCFSISDANGDLLFFSDGTYMWDKDYVRLPYTLTGNRSSAQSGTIVVYPGELNKYLALTLGEHSANNLSYTVVNVDAQRKATIDPIKNNILFKGKDGVLLSNTNTLNERGYLGESVTVGRHKNRKDLWVLAPGRSIIENTGPFFLNVWKITESGPIENLHSTYKIDNPSFSTSRNQPGGYIKFTSDSKHFAWLNFGKRAVSTFSPTESFLCYGDFDNENGLISNVRLKEIKVDRAFGYGVEFTNDNKYIYLTLAPDNMTGAYGSALFVYDFDELLAVTEQSDINNIEPVYEIVSPSSEVNNNLNNKFGSIQTGPDGRMYISRLKGTNSTNLYVIDNPKDPRNLRMYLLPFTLTNQYTFWGLPNFAVPWYNTGIEIPISANQICPNTELDINFYIVDGEGFDKIDKIKIDFGDGSDLLIYEPVTAGIHEEKHTYKFPGLYTITAKSYSIDEDNNDQEIETTSVSKVLIVNTCAMRVNPMIRGELRTN